MILVVNAFTGKISFCRNIQKVELFNFSNEKKRKRKNYLFVDKISETRALRSTDVTGMTTKTIYQQIILNNYDITKMKINY